MLVAQLHIDVQVSTSVYIHAAVAHILLQILCSVSEVTTGAEKEQQNSMCKLSHIHNYHN